MPITKVIARVTVADIEQAIEFYRAITGVDEVQRFTFNGTDLAGVGSFLLLSGPNANKVSDRVATLVVTELDQILRHLDKFGGTTREGPSAGPTGRRVIAQHPDGAVFEYIEQPPAI